MEASLHLERVIDGLRIGCWPFCAPLARWNEAAEIYPCLAIAVDDEAASVVATSREVPSSDSACRDKLTRWTRGATGRAGSSVTMGDRLRFGITCSRRALPRHPASYWDLQRVDWRSPPASTTSSALPAGFGASVTASAAAKFKSGLVLILAALVFSRITQALRDRRATRRRTSWTGVGCRDRQTVVSLMPDVYRAGVTLQSLALLGFVIW